MKKSLNFLSPYIEFNVSSEKAIPIIILYIELGLAISTIALDLGSTYVRRLYYIGRKVQNISNVKIWFGSRE